MRLVDTPFRDRALVGILGGNLCTLVVAVVFDWGLVEALWPFWIQSVVIGWYARQRILKLEAFCTEGTTFNDRPLAPDEAGKRAAANFFALHFGLFHLFYLFFLVAFTMTASPEGYIDVRNEGTGEMMAVRVGTAGPLDWLAFLALGYAFRRAHGASHAEHVQADLAGRPNIGALTAIPYARVLPMHLSIIVGVWSGGGTAAIVIFIVLKTIADVAMHRFEHQQLQRQPASVLRKAPSNRANVRR